MTYLLNLRKFLAPEIIFGVGALELAGQDGRNLGGTNALVVSDPGVVRAGWVQQVLASIEGAGLRSALFTSVSPNPRIEEVEAGAVTYAEQRCDVIVAVGGGIQGAQSGTFTALVILCSARAAISFSTPVL